MLSNEDFMTSMNCISAWKIERRKSGVCGEGLNFNMYSMEGMFGSGISASRRERVCFEVEPAFRSETRTRRVIDKQRMHGRAQAAG